MEPLIEVLTRIAVALEKLEDTGIMVLLDSDNVYEVLKEVKGD